MTVGRVGRPHGLDGSFVVERPSDDPRALRARRDRATPAASRPPSSRAKRSGGRLVVRLDRTVERGAELEVPASELPPAGEGELLRLPARRPRVVEEGGRALGRGARRSTPGVANDVLELDAGSSLPMVEDCVLAVDLEGGPDRRCARLRARRLTSPPMQIDVFTLLPHAFAWLTEQRPVAAVLGTELDLRFFNYRDYTPLAGGQVDDEPYGGGAGMVLRVDVVCAALEAVYGDVRRPARDRASPRRDGRSTRRSSRSSPRRRR